MGGHALLFSLQRPPNKNCVRRVSLSALLTVHIKHVLFQLSVQLMGSCILCRYITQEDCGYMQESRCCSNFIQFEGPLLQEFPGPIPLLSSLSPLTTRLLLAPAEIKLVSNSFPPFHVGPGKFCFVKRSSSTFSHTVFLHNVFAVVRTQTDCITSEQYCVFIVHSFILTTEPGNMLAFELHVCFVIFFLLK